MDCRNRGFRRMVRSNALDGKAENGTSFLVRLCLGAGLGISDDGSGLMRYFIFERIEQFGLCLVGGHARDLLQTNTDLLFGFIEIVLTAVELALHGRDLMLSGVQRLFARVKRLNAAIKRLFALIDALLCSAHLLQAFLVLCLGLLTKSQCFVLGFDYRFATQSFRLAFCVFDNGMSFVGSTLGRRFGDEFIDDETGGDADDGANDKPNDGFHACPPFEFGRVLWVS